MFSIHRKSCYILAVFTLFQALIGNEGERWILADYQELKDAAAKQDAYAMGFLSLVHVHGDKGQDISYSPKSRLGKIIGWDILPWDI